MASKVIERIIETADKLYEIRQRISELEEAKKIEVDALKTERDAIQAVLLADLQKNDLSSIKSRAGDSFSRQTRKSIEIISEPHALKWAIDNRAVSVNKLVVNQLLKDVKEVPPCFEIVESEFISVRKSKKEDETI